MQFYVVNMYAVDSGGRFFQLNYFKQKYSRSPETIKCGLSTICWLINTFEHPYVSKTLHKMVLKKDQDCFIELFTHLCDQKNAVQRRKIKKGQ